MRVCILGDARSVHVQRISRGLAGCGLDMTVITHHPVEIEDVQVQKFAVPHAGLRYPARWVRRREMYLKNIMRTHDVVQVHFLHDWGITEEIAENGCLTLTPWGSDIQLPRDLPAPSPDLVAARIAMLRMADAVIVTCKTFAEQIAPFARIGWEKIRIVPKGVDTSLFQPSPSWPPPDCVVGYFKGFRPVNGPRYLIEAIPAVLEACPEAKFEFVGGGPLLDECRRLAAELRVAKAIRWLPPQCHQEMPAVMSRWSVVAIPAVMEAFCIGALESSAMEIPVVASRVGGLVETVRDGLTGILVPPASPSHLAGGIIELLEDRQRGKLMGRAGRRVVQEEYEWADSLGQLIESYEWAMASKTTVFAG
ncbi:MAG: glycosyltransferase family 4 protein [Phycisphaerae bacterium]|nr:glycosyltransferase family 4 protein [Phycisphaerae bacterium]